MERILLACIVLFTIGTQASNAEEGNIEQMYYESGKLKSETIYKNDKKEGVEKTYYDTGKLKSETPYKNDKKEGVEKTYFETGKLKSETTYKNGKKEGVEKTYFDTGKLKSVNGTSTIILTDLAECVASVTISGTLKKAPPAFLTDLETESARVEELETARASFKDNMIFLDFYNDCLKLLQK